MILNKYLPYDICKWLQMYKEEAGDITLIENKNLFISIAGKTVKSPFFISKSMMSEVVEKMCKNSLYANQNTLKNGYITIEGGHRVGVVGSIVRNDNDEVTHMRNISGLNIRISRDIIGAANKVIGGINNNGRIYNTLIIAPPGAGKTTMLRDIARQLGQIYRVGIVDERSEICAGKDTGEFTFVLDGCPKSKGIIMMIRSMSPDVILTDEIGTYEDEMAIEKTINAGVKIVCTVHGFGIEDAKKRGIIKDLIENKVFEKTVVMSERLGKGTVESISDT